MRIEPERQAPHSPQAASPFSPYTASFSVGSCRVYEEAFLPEEAITWGSRRAATWTSDLQLGVRGGRGTLQGTFPIAFPGSLGGVMFCPQESLIKQSWLCS